MKKAIANQKGFICFYLLIFLILLVIGCSKSPNNDTVEQEKAPITGSVVEESQLNCRFANESDCRPIVIMRGEPTEEEEMDDEIPPAESTNITDKPVYNITLQNLTSLSLACEAGWKCIKGSHIAYQEANCSWHSIERCIYGCNENESMCRLAPICKVKSLKCENDNLMICGEEGYKWLLNKSCDKDCENNICTEDINATVTLNATTNISNSTTQNDFIADGCMSVLKYNLTGDTATDEYFTLKNSCSYQIDMTGWTASDNVANHLYTFPSFNLASNGKVTIVTGDGINNQTTLYWGRGCCIWNDGGDTLYLNASNSTSILIKILTP